MRTVAAPTKLATLGETPRRSRILEIFAEARPGDRIADVVLALRRSSRFISALSGPIDQPSPITSSVTPWRMSLWPRPSSIRDLGRPAQHVDEAGRDGEAAGVDLAGGRVPATRPPTATIRSPRIATSPMIGRAAAAVVDRAAADDDVVASDGGVAAQPAGARLAPRHADGSGSFQASVISLRRRLETLRPLSPSSSRSAARRRSSRQQQHGRDGGDGREHARRRPGGPRRLHSRADQAGDEAAGEDRQVPGGDRGRAEPRRRQPGEQAEAGRAGCRARRR